MKKSRSFSIYLLKEGYEAATALKSDHSLEETEATDLPEGASLFVSDFPAKPPWWKAYFGVVSPLLQSHKGALVFLPVEDRCFALSFGQVFHHLDDHSYEYDFGLRVTLNCLDPKELKSADMVAPGLARRKRTQVPAATELTYLDFDGNSEIIKSLTGKVKEEHKELFKNATGSIALKVSLQLESEELVDACSKLLDLYKREDFKISFPNIQNIAPVKDPDITAILDEALVRLVRAKDDQVTLTIPDIIDYRDNTCCMFQGDEKASDVYPDISIEHFYESLGGSFDLSSLTIDSLRRSRMLLTDVEGNVSQTYPIYRTLICDVQLPSDPAVYHLCEGNWYKAEISYVNRVTTYLDQKCETADLLPYNHDDTKNGKAVYSESNYNEAIPAWKNEFICLDRTNISPSGNSDIEPCDVYKIDADTQTSTGHRAIFYHIKVSTRSAQLSHLFNQGVNSIELIQLESSFRDELKKRIVERLNGNDMNSYLSPIDSSEFKVVFGIITHKDSSLKSQNLPLFSKISLMRNMQRLDLYKIPSALAYIEDKSPKKQGHPKHPQIVVVVCGSSDGKIEVRPEDGQGFDPAVAITRCPKQISESPIGTRFLLSVKKSESGELSTYHGWPYRPYP